jgi:CBS domain-containing protein
MSETITRTPPITSKELEEIAKRVAEGQRPTITVRTLLSWFSGSKRRGSRIVAVIREALDALNLDTVPDFNWVHLDAQVEIMSKTDAAKYTGEPDNLQAAAHQAASTEGLSFHDPTFRIGRLEMANRPPVVVPPDATIQKAITIMLRSDFSQLPVMANDRDVKGIFSWKSLGSRKPWGQNYTYVREAMDHCNEISVDATLFDAIDILRKEDCVLIRDVSKRICGIITPYDISETFSQLGEPFLVLGEIENHIRGLIEGKFTKEELAEARDSNGSPRPIERVADLTLGECVRILEKPQNWQRLGLQIDRTIFINELDEIRRIRNEVMHFDPEGIDKDDLAKLRGFVTFLQKLQKLRPKTNSAP